MLEQQQQQRCAVCLEERPPATFTATCSTHAPEVCGACLAHPLMGHRCPICRGELASSALTAAARKRSRSQELRAEERVVRRRLREDAREARRLFREINDEYIIRFVRSSDDDDDTSSVSVDSDSARDDTAARELEVYADV